jgi:hypothetical protein
MDGCMKLPGCATVYMTGIIGQQFAKFHHINIFNIANLLRINCNRSFRLFIVLKPWISAEKGFLALAINDSMAACSTFAVVSPTLPERSNAVSSEAM